MAALSPIPLEMVFENPRAFLERALKEDIVLPAECNLVVKKVRLIFVNDDEQEEKSEFDIIKRVQSQLSKIALPTCRVFKINENREEGDEVPIGVSFKCGEELHLEFTEKVTLRLISPELLCFRVDELYKSMIATRFYKVQLPGPQVALLDITPMQCEAIVASQSLVNSVLTPTPSGFRFQFEMRGLRVRDLNEIVVDETKRRALLVSHNAFSLALVEKFEFNSKEMFRERMLLTREFVLPAGKQLVIKDCASIHHDYRTFIKNCPFQIDLLHFMLGQLMLPYNYTVKCTAGVCDCKIEDDIVTITTQEEMRLTLVTSTLFVDLLELRSMLIERPSARRFLELQPKQKLVLYNVANHEVQEDDLIDFLRSRSPIGFMFEWKGDVFTTDRIEAGFVVIASEKPFKINLRQATPEELTYQILSANKDLLALVKQNKPEAYAFLLFNLFFNWHVYYYSVSPKDPIPTCVKASTQQMMRELLEDQDFLTAYDAINENQELFDGLKLFLSKLDTNLYSKIAATKGNVFGPTPIIVAKIKALVKNEQENSPFIQNVLPRVLALIEGEQKEAAGK